MDERILFLTGRLAHDSLCREIEGLKKRRFSWRVHELGLQVAGLMTADMIGRRLADAGDAQRILVPGLCGGDVEALSQVYGVPVERGPKDLKDLPEYFGTAGRRPDLSEYRVAIFAEIVDAPNMGVGQIVERAAAYRADGADVIDLGCLPGAAFPHLEDAVSALKHEGHAVSVDSLEPPELRRGAAAGADYLLSLKESTLHLAEEAAGTPVLIPERPSDLDSLYRAAETLAGQGRRFLLDPILEPIHFGFTESLLRYHAVRRRYPEAEIMMGIGNLTELTDADTTGMTAVLMGVASELDVGAVLTTEVSPHARTAVRETDVARRVMFAAKRDGNLPQRYHPGLMALKDRKPFPHTSEEVARVAAAVKDPSYRIQLTREGIHVYNRDGRQLATDPFALYPALVPALAADGDASHAFYLGVELGRAQIAWQLGKRYLQDNELEWGVAVRGASDGIYRSGATSGGDATGGSAPAGGNPGIGDGANRGGSSADHDADDGANSSGGSADRDADDGANRCGGADRGADDGANHGGATTSGGVTGT